MTPDLSPLIQNPDVRRLMQVAQKAGGELRVVGGAVRDLVMGRAIGDIDMASTLTPDRMAEALHAEGIKCVPTGIDFGTVTAVVNGAPHEITTLRHDVETDGRHATVAFTDDWQADAARRDLTMNALYADQNGTLYDYFGGAADAASGTVRFIGDAAARIEEDILRILRFFRFYAWFGRGPIDAVGLEACRTHAAAIATLSAERVWKEIAKLLAASNPLPGWQAMKQCGVLATTLPEAANLARLQALLQAERRYDAEPRFMRRLAALLPPDEKTAATVAAKLKMARRESTKLGQLVKIPALLKGKFDPVPFRRALNEWGVEDAVDAALIATADHPETDLTPALDAAASWTFPTFPMQGQDALNLGIAPGPAMGELLRHIQQKWVDSDFQMTREECIALATKLSTT